MALPLIGRRDAMAAALMLPIAAPLLARTPPGAARLTLLGQALIQHDVCHANWPERSRIAELLRGMDAVFTDLETAIHGDTPLAPTRDGKVLHVAGPEVIDCLKAIGVDLVATSNNHAWDLGTAGIVAALDALDRRGMVHAGSGRDLAAASRPATLHSSAGPIALVAGAAGAIREGASATASRAGVNELRRGADGLLNREDVARMTANIAAARASGALVIAYLHNHYWQPDPADTAPWQRVFAHACIDAGAAVFVAHGPPLLQGTEMYRGAPLFHGLGSFIFQTIKPPEAYGAVAWQSFIVRCRFENDRFRGAELIPLILDPVGDNTAPVNATRGLPRIAEGAAAATILRRMQSLSNRFGVQFRVEGGRAFLDDSSNQHNATKSGIWPEGNEK